MALEYDFSDIEPDEPEEELEDPRKNFRVARSCGNCRYYFYTGVKSRKGFCKLPNLENVNMGAYHNAHIEDQAKAEGWPPTHSTNVCDEHEMRGRRSIDIVEDCTGKKFNFDGTQNHNIINDDLYNTDD